VSATETPPDATAAAPQPCPRCGAPLRPDQDWCLSCGAAVTTDVHGPPSWRTPFAVVAAVLVVAAAVLVIAFVRLSDDAAKVAQAPAPTATPPAATATPDAALPSETPDATFPDATPTVTPEATATPWPGTTPTPAPEATTTPAPGEVGEWPAGKSAYTVILWSATTRSQAEAKAESLAGDGVDSVGVLRSDDYSSLKPGYWVVFSGQYDSAELAGAAAKAAGAKAPGAYAREIKPTK
jgi:hypothetical protein